MQEELISVQDLPASQAERHRGPLADWPLHRLLQQVTCDRFTTWRGDLYEVRVDADGHHRAHRPDPRDAVLVEQLRRAGLVHVGLWLFADIDGQYRETHRLDLSRAGWRVLRGWMVRTRHACPPYSADQPREAHRLDDGTR